MRSPSTVHPEALLQRATHTSSRRPAARDPAHSFWHISSRAVLWNEHCSFVKSWQHEIFSSSRHLTRWPTRFRHQYQCEACPHCGAVRGSWVRLWLTSSQRPWRQPLVQRHRKHRHPTSPRYRNSSCTRGSDKKRLRKSTTYTTLRHLMCDKRRRRYSMIHSKFCIAICYECPMTEGFTFPQSGRSCFTHINHDTHTHTHEYGTTSTASSQHPTLKSLVSHLRF